MITSKLRQKFNSLGNILGSGFLTGLFVLGIENFKRKDGTKGIGVRIACNEGYTFRFNFNKGTKRYIVNRSCLIVDSIDFWVIKDINSFDTPTCTVEFFPGTNILENWKEILINFINGRFKPYESYLTEANISDISNNIMGFFKNPEIEKRSAFINTIPKAKRLLSDKKFLRLSHSEWLDVLNEYDLLNAWYDYSRYTPYKPDKSLQSYKQLNPSQTDFKSYKNTTANHRSKFISLYPEYNIPVSALQCSKQQWNEIIADLNLDDEWEDFLRDEDIRLKNIEGTKFTKDEENGQYFKNPSINKKAVFIKMHPEYRFPLNSMHYVKNDWDSLLNKFNLADEWEAYEQRLKQEKEDQLNSKWNEGGNKYKNKTFDNRANFMRMHADCNIPRSALRVSNDEFMEILKKNDLEKEWEIFINDRLKISRITKHRKESNSLADDYGDYKELTDSTDSTDSNNAENINDLNTSNNMSDTNNTGNSDSKEVFKRLSIGLDMLLRSPTQRSMIVVGSPGTGKTYTIREFLENALGKVGNKWDYAVLSRISDSQLYETLYRNRNKILVLDEATGFLTDGKNTAVQDMLKSTLQSIRLSRDEMKEFYGKMKSRRQENVVLPIMDLKKDDTVHSAVVYYKTRSTHKFIDANDDDEIINYCRKLDRFIIKGGQVGEERYRDAELVSMALPERFFYNGKIIFISNNKLEDVNSAIKDRSYVVSIDLNKEGMINRIKEVAGDIFDIEDIDTVVHEISKSSKRISLRSFFSAMNTYATNPDNDYWKIAATL